MHSNNIFKKYFSYIRTLEWSFLQYSLVSSHPSIITIDKPAFCTISFFFFFPGVRNSCFSPFIILLSVMFPSSFFLVFIFYKVLRWEQIFKKGEQGVSANRNTSTIQECCHPHLNIHFWVEEKDRQTATCICKAMCIVYAKTWAAAFCLVIPPNSFKAEVKRIILQVTFWHIQKTVPANKNTQVAPVAIVGSKTHFSFVSCAYCLLEPNIHCKQYVCYTRMTIH